MVGSRESSLENKVSLAEEKSSIKLSKVVDKILDSIRIFSCFLGDLCVYFYNLDNLIFLCMTATGDNVQIAQNPFLSSDMLANYFLDLMFKTKGATNVAELMKYQSKDQNELLLTNVALIRKLGNWKEIGLPAELLSAAHETFLSDESEANQNPIISQAEYSNLFASPNPSKFKSNTKDLRPNSGLFKVSHTSKQPISDVSTKEFDSRSPNHAKSKALDQNEDEQESQNFSLFAESPVCRVIGENYSFFMDCTVIKGGMKEPLADLTTNETQANILDLLQMKDEGSKEATQILFPGAVEIFKKIASVSEPCSKLYLTSAAIVQALHEMRQLYSDKHPDTETKVKVTLETVLSILIYIIIKSDLPDVISEYKIMKVYFLLGKEHNHGRLVYLLKSAIKSINKLGVYHARHSV